MDVSGLKILTIDVVECDAAFKQQALLFIRILILACRKAHNTSSSFE